MDPSTPSITQRTGSLQWLAPPVGGRDWLRTTLDGTVSVAGSIATHLAPDGTLVRFDLATLSRSQIGAFGPVDGRYRSLATRGERWALALGDPTHEKAAPAGCWVDGVALAEPIDTLSFASDGTLFGFRGNKIVRVDARGAVLWQGGERGSLLAAAGDRPVAAGFARVWLFDESLAVTLHNPTIQDAPQQLLANERFAAAIYWHQSPSSNRWVYSVGVWDLATQRERVVELASWDGAFVLVGDKLWWSTGELDLATLEQRRFDVPAFASSGSVMSTVEGTSSIGVVGDEAWIVTRPGAVRRISLATHQERGEGLTTVQHMFSAAIADDGRTLVGRDGGWDLYDAEGALVHHGDLEQAAEVAVDPRGRWLAVGGTLGTQVYATSALLQPIATIDLVGSLSFSPDGSRLLVGDDGALLVYDAETAGLQAQLTVKGFARGAFAHGRIVATAEEYAYVFDDPGALPIAKKTPKFKHALRYTAYPDRSASAAVAVVGSRVAVCQSDALSLYEGAASKAVETANAHAIMAPHGNVLAIAEAEGAALYRWGESAPFAKLPCMPTSIDASRDGARVVAIVAEGVARWTEEGGRTPAIEPSTISLPIKPSKKRR